MISDQWRLGTGCSDVLFKRIVFQSFIRMASAADIAKLETKAVAAEKLIELLRQQISQVGERCVKLLSIILVLSNLDQDSPGWRQHWPVGRIQSGDCQA